MTKASRILLLALAFLVSIPAFAAKTKPGICNRLFSNIPFYSKAYQEVYFRREAGRGRNIRYHYNYIMKNQWASADEIAAGQLISLKNLLTHAGESVPYYKKIFAEAGFNPENLKSRDDLVKLPMLTKDIIRKEYKNLITEGATGEHFTKSTSGSTGEPTVIEYSVESESWRQATKLRGWGWAGYEMGTPSVFYWGGAIKPGSKLAAVKIAADRGLRNEIYIDSLKQDPATLEQATQLIKAFKPKTIVCYTQACSYFAKWIIENNKRDWDDIAVVGGAEPMFPADRAALNEAFGPDVFETYGSRETMLMAAECPAHNGMHLSEENILVEVLSPEGDKKVPAGDRGTVLVTDLNNYWMPMIRYQNGDAAVMMPEGQSCPCGRGLRRLQKVDGRLPETFTAIDGTKVPGILFHLTFSYLPQKAVKKFQVIQKREGNVIFKIVKGTEFDTNQKTFEKQVNLAVDYLNGTPVSIEFVDDIPPSASGKQKTIIVEK